MKHSQENDKICNAVSARGIACKFRAKENSDKCGRCANKKPTPRPFKKGIDNPNALNFGGRGWTTFLDDDIIKLASAALNTPDYFTLNQEIEFVNVDLAAMAKQLASGNGFPFDKWADIRSLYRDAQSAWHNGDGEGFAEAFAKLGGLIQFCNEQHMLKMEFNRTMARKGDFISRQQAIKEKEKLYVELEKMLVFGATIIQVIDFVMPKGDKLARKYRTALYSALAPKFGFEINKTNKLKQIGDGEISDQPEDNFILDDDAEEIARLENDDELEALLKGDDEAIDGEVIEDE